MNATVKDMEKKNREVPLDRILLDERCQPRERINDATIVHYAERIEEGDVFPPIGIVWDGESFWCWDGFHRVLSNRKAGNKNIHAVVTSGTFDDAVRMSLSANSQNGMQRSHADVTRSISRAWNDLGLRDTGEIAELLKCTDRFVQKVTKEWREHEKQQRNAKIIELANEGKNQTEIAEQTGTGLGTVNRTLKDFPKTNSSVLENADKTSEEPFPRIPERNIEIESSPDPEPLVLTPSTKLPEYITLKDWESIPQAERMDALNFSDSSKVLNRQDNASIEWAQWSWNPITGCRHDCPYCYARDIANRFYEQGFEPALYPGRFSAPGNTSVPEKAKEDMAFKNIFTCSMADLFGRWVPAEWIESVLFQVRANPQWNFLFLTKFPKRMSEFDYPKNAWLGTSVDCQARVKAAEDAFSKLGGGTKWLSVEPMLEPLKFKRLELFDWIVVGGASKSNQTPEWVPPIDWIVDLHQQARKAGCRIYYKTNCGMLDSLRIKEFPWQEPKPKELPQAFKYLGMK